MWIKLRVSCQISFRNVAAGSKGDKWINQIKPFRKWCQFDQVKRLTFSLVCHCLCHGILWQRDCCLFSTEWSETDKMFNYLISVYILWTCSFYDTASVCRTFWSIQNAFVTGFVESHWSTLKLMDSNDQ